MSISEIACHLQGPQNIAQKIITKFAGRLYQRANAAYHQSLMTNTIAFCLALLIIGFFTLDHVVLEWGVPTFLMRRLVELIDYLAFWR